MEGALAFLSYNKLKKPFGYSFEFVLLLFHYGCHPLTLHRVDYSMYLLDQSCGQGTQKVIQRVKVFIYIPDRQGAVPSSTVMDNPRLGISLMIDRFHTGDYINYIS